MKDGLIDNLLRFGLTSLAAFGLNAAVAATNTEAGETPIPKKETRRMPDDLFWAFDTQRLLCLFPEFEEEGINSRLFKLQHPVAVIPEQQTAPLKIYSKPDLKKGEVYRGYDSNLFDKTKFILEKTSQQLGFERWNVHRFNLTPTHPVVVFSLQRSNDDTYTFYQPEITASRLIRTPQVCREGNP